MDIYNNNNIIALFVISFIKFPNKKPATKD